MKKTNIRLANDTAREVRLWLNQVVIPYMYLYKAFDIEMPTIRIPKLKKKTKKVVHESKASDMSTGEVIDLLHYINAQSNTREPVKRQVTTEEKEKFYKMYNEISEELERLEKGL